jgi:YHS domain-containing protein
MFVFVLSVLGCGSPAATTPPAAASADFTNAKGELVCPVMGDVVASKEQAQGHTEHDGKTYWFCCDSCSHAFAADPERYEDGKFLAHLDAEHDGKWAACNHPL